MTCLRRPSFARQSGLREGGSDATSASRWQARPAAACAAFVAGVLFLGDATAQTACGTRRDVAEFLRQHYREVVVAHGVTANGALLEILAAPGGNWTLIVTAPDGRACVLASGEGWQAAGPPV